MVSDNAAASDRLAALVAQLSDADLSADLGGGWTVTTALGHLAFWDRQQAQAVAAWPERVAQSDEVNATLEPILTALQPREAATLALAAARELDEAIAALPAETQEEIRASGYGYIVERAPHRLEHLTQIERALGRG